MTLKIGFEYMQAVYIFCNNDDLFPWVLSKDIMI